MALVVSKDNPTLYEVILGNGGGKAEALVKVGSNLDKFVPNVNASKWFDEAWINLNHKAMSVVSEKEFFINDTISLKVGGITWKSWTLGPRVLECSLTYDALKDLPVGGKIVLELKDSGNLGYSYQGELAQDEIEEGCHRPDNVVGSYAVYFNKCNNQYYTGKFCHIYRWEVTGADGKKKWCEPLQIKDGNLIIGLPDVSDMVFPIVCMGAGDTLGFESVGASNGGAYEQVGDLGNMPEAGTLDSLVYYTSVSNQNDRESVGTVYADTGGGEPGALIAHSDVLFDAQWNPGWTTDDGLITGVPLMTMAGDLPNGARIYGGQSSEISSTHYYYDGTAGYSVWRKDTSVFPDPSDPWPVATDVVGTPRRISAFINYTPAAGGTTHELVATEWSKTLSSTTLTQILETVSGISSKTVNYSLLSRILEYAGPGISRTQSSVSLSQILESIGTGISRTQSSISLSRILESIGTGISRTQSSLILTRILDALSGSISKTLSASELKTGIQEFIAAVASKSLASSDIIRILGLASPVASRTQSSTTLTQILEILSRSSEKTATYSDLARIQELIVLLSSKTLSSSILAPVRGLSAGTIEKTQTLSDISRIFSLAGADSSKTVASPLLSVLWEILGTVIAQTWSLSNLTTGLGTTHELISNIFSKVFTRPTLNNDSIDMIAAAIANTLAANVSLTGAWGLNGRAMSRIDFFAALGIPNFSIIDPTIESQTVLREFAFETVRRALTSQTMVREIQNN